MTPVPTAKDPVIRGGCTCARRRAASQPAGSGGARHRGASLRRSLPGPRPLPRTPRWPGLGTWLQGGRKRGLPAHSRFWFGEEAGWAFPVFAKWSGSSDGKPVTGQGSWALPDAWRPETTWAAICASRHLQGGTRAASAAPALCLAPHLHVPTHQAALRRAGPPVVVKTLASDARECGRRRILCKGPRASGVSGGPGEQPAHQVGRLAPC